MSTRSFSCTCAIVLPIGSLFNFCQGNDCLKDFDLLFDDKLSKLTFYEHAKVGRKVEMEDKMMKIN